MIYVSISTIPQRIKNLNDSVESLLNQTKKPDKIFINIPFKYERFKETIQNNEIPKFDDSKVEITRCEDCGPGTKLLGSLNKFKKNSLVILADDDHIYEDYMIEKLYYFYSKAPNNAYSFYQLKGQLLLFLKYIHFYSYIHYILCIQTLKNDSYLCYNHLL